MKLFIAFLVLLPAIGLADVEMRFSDGSFGLVNNGRVMFGDDEGGVLIVPGEKSMIIISHAERSWMRMAPGFANEMANQVQAQMNAMLAEMPPEQRAMVEQQMAGMMSQGMPEMPTLSVRRTGNTSEVAGYDCDEAEIVDDGGIVEEIVCVASADELGISNRDFDALIRAMEGMAEVAGINGDSVPEMDFKALGGIPIQNRGSEFDADSELVSVDTAGVDASRLEIPADYQEISLDEMIGQ